MKAIKKSISLDPILFEFAENFARRKGSTFSNFINDAIEAFFKFDKKTRMLQAYAEYYSKPHVERDKVAKEFLKLAKKTLPENVPAAH